MFGFDRIIEQKIQEAMKNGEFDNLPNKGKPLLIEDLSGVPEDLRMGYKVLKNAGLLPEELELKKEISTLEELISNASYDNEKLELEQSKLAAKILRFKMLMEKKKK